MRLCQAPLCVKHERACAATQVFVCVISASGMMQTPNLETVFSSCGGKWVRKGPPYLVQCKDSCESEEQRGQRRSRGWCDSRHCGRMFCICTVVSFSLLNGRSKRGLCQLPKHVTFNGPTPITSSGTGTKPGVDSMYLIVFLG